MTLHSGSTLKAPGLLLLDLPADQLPQGLKDVIQQDHLPLVDHTLHIGYDQMSADEIIRVCSAHRQHWLMGMPVPGGCPQCMVLTHLHILAAESCA